MQYGMEWVLRMLIGGLTLSATMPNMQQGSKGGALYRVYPGPWQVALSNVQIFEHTNTPKTAVHEYIYTRTHNAS